MFVNKSRRLAMAQWDVFSSKALEGNSLAVFFDARGVSDAEMQLIAKEMNLSETTFICPRDAEIERQRGVRVRISPCRKSCHLRDIPPWGQLLPCAGIPDRRKLLSS
jgi:trans-2,3-dihydro-3-hydroxyanthranilate isomerase